MKNPYKVLEIPEKSDMETIKKAYRELSKKTHPDANGGSRKYEDKFNEVQEAYKILSDPEQKKQIDLILDEYKSFIYSNYVRQNYTTQSYTRPQYTAQNYSNASHYTEKTYTEEKSSTDENSNNIKDTPDNNDGIGILQFFAVIIITIIIIFVAQVILIPDDNWFTDKSDITTSIEQVEYELSGNWNNLTVNENPFNYKGKQCIYGYRYYLMFNEDKFMLFKYEVYTTEDKNGKPKSVEENNYFDCGIIIKENGHTYLQFLDVNIEEFSQNEELLKDAKPLEDFSSTDEVKLFFKQKDILEIHINDKIIEFQKEISEQPSLGLNYCEGGYNCSGPQKCPGSKQKSCSGAVTKVCSEAKRCPHGFCAPHGYDINSGLWECELGDICSHFYVEPHEYIENCPHGSATAHTYKVKCEHGFMESHRIGTCKHAYSIEHIVKCEHGFEQPHYY